MDKSLKYGILCLVIILLSRTLFLEYSDLIDPTEARYATVAQYMVSSGDWLIPMLPMPEGVVPYFSKPPLHYWLTAVLYSIFGVEEWTARIPSILSAIGILFGIFLFARRLFTPEIALGACLMTISSALFFLLAGASVTDVTLTAFTTAATACAYLFVRDVNADKKLIWWSVLFISLGFLCKGPVAIVLSLLPIFFWMIWNKTVEPMKRVPWVSAFIILLAVTLPWFFLSEFKHPGFLRYYFWNENLARYLIKDYGDRYGSGHVRPYGIIWLMAAASFLPWTIILATQVIKNGLKHSWRIATEDRDMMFVLIWAITTPVFFTFVRQLHIMYAIPGLPPLALLTSMYLQRSNSPLLSLTLPTRSTILNVSSVFWVGIVCLAPIFNNSAFNIAVGLVTIAIGYLYIKKYMCRDSSSSCTLSFLSSIAVTAYLVTISTVMPYVGREKSSEDILKAFIQISPPTDRAVGIVSSNTFSVYWVTQNWEEELGAPVQVSYIDAEHLEGSTLRYFLINERHDREVPEDINRDFTLLLHINSWRLYERKASA